jgi:hypothetical protein
MPPMIANHIPNRGQGTGELAGGRPLREDASEDKLLPDFPQFVRIV